jgi:hypothetical protein
LTAGGLEAAFRQAVRDPLIRARAAALATHLQAEDGIAAAVAAVSRYLRSGTAPIARPQPLVKETAHAK